MSTRHADFELREGSASYWIVIQHGGSSVEFYPSLHETEEEAQAHIDDCAKHTYDCDGPFEVPKTPLEIGARAWISNILRCYDRDNSAKRRKRLGVLTLITHAAAARGRELLVETS